MNKKKKIVLVLVGILAIIGLTTGVTYSMIHFRKVGTKENSMTSGGVTFHYGESGRSVILNEAIPTPDSLAKLSNNYF